MANVKKISTNTTPLSAANSKFSQKGLTPHPLPRIRAKFFLRKSQLRKSARNTQYPYIKYRANKNKKISKLIALAEKISLKAGMGLPAAAEATPKKIMLSKIDGRLIKNKKNTMLTAAQAKRDKSSPILTEEKNTEIVFKTVKAVKAIPNKPPQIITCWGSQTLEQKFTLQELLNVINSTVVDDKSPVILPSFVDHLPDYSDILSKIVKQMPAVGTITSSQASCLINLALQTGIAYSHKLWAQHATAAKTGYSLGVRENDDSQRWASRVEACYVEELKKGFLPKIAISNAYWTVTNEFYAGKNMTAKQMRDRKLNPKLRRWWHFHYPERKNEQ